MRFYYKIGRVILSFICLILFSQSLIFAQNDTNLKTEIYAKLKCCPCKNSFAKCTCPEAKEIKAYVDALLEAGLSKEDIFYKVAKKFSLNTILDQQIKIEVEKRIIKEAGEKRPQITIEPTSFDLGQVTKKQGKISRIFKLSNKGNSNLSIKHIKTSCPCASVSLAVGKNKSAFFSTEGSPKDWQSQIIPGQSAELELMVDLASPHVKPGKLIRDASIISNDPVYPELTVRVDAEVKD